MSVTVLGLDPGIASLGWAVVRVDGRETRLRASGCIETSPRDGDDLARVDLIACEVGDLLLGWSLDLVATEAWVHYGQSDSTAAHTMGLVIGAIRTVCRSAGVRHVEGPRAQGWRTALGLKATATKPEAQERVRLLLGLAAPVRPQHASDAAAVAIVAARSARPALQRVS